MQIMTEPSVSVLLPVRNEEKFLPQALGSIFRQTMQSWELVAVDDGSSDGTASILEAASCRDKRVRVVRPNKRGLVPALIFPTPNAWKSRPPSLTPILMWGWLPARSDIFPATG
jgi:cellulose synthase/poly-beta-1,6-N-acetylglucosamine synthase-like glycosyltransferase